MRASSPPSHRGCILIPYAPTVEIKDYTRLFGEAAANAVHKASFDSVTLRDANGYLPDQFQQDVTNKRTDAYGGTIENRCRFALEVIDAVTEAVGESKVGFRISPWSTFQGTYVELGHSSRTHALIHPFQTCVWKTLFRRSRISSRRSCSVILTWRICTLSSPGSQEAQTFLRTKTRSVVPTS